MLAIVHAAAEKPFHPTERGDGNMSRSGEQNPQRNEYLTDADEGDFNVRKCILHLSLAINKKKGRCGPWQGDSKDAANGM